MGYFLFTFFFLFHRDPLPFDNGFKLLWRNGDLVDPTGQKVKFSFNSFVLKMTTFFFFEKCRISGTEGTVVGNPTESHVTIYSWVYVW